MRSNAPSNISALASPRTSDTLKTMANSDETREGEDDTRRQDAAKPARRRYRPDETLRIDADEISRYAQARKRRGSLLVIAGAAADVGTHLLVGGRVIIGRDPERDDPERDELDGDDLSDDALAEPPREIPLQLRDGRSSRRHASVEPSDGDYVLKDLGSTNGTILRGTPIASGSEHILHDGDQIALGKTVIKFTLVDDTEAAYLARIERLAGTDDLTGLLAKHRFDSLLADAVLTARQHPVALSVLMMDLDGLKAINDRHGHHLGAHTIGAVGHLLGEIVRGRGEACRFGGDEFCAFLPGLALDRAKLVAERIRRTVEETTFSHLNASTQVSISVGVAILTDDVGTGEELLARADRALYRAKASGRNRVAT